MIKKFISVFLLTFALASPVTAYAQSSTDLFEVISDESPNIVIAPGDIWSDSFKVTNKTQENIKVKLDHLENIGDSSLYDVLQVEINGQTFRHLDDVTSDWITLKKNETYVFYTEFHFPNEYKNEYQGKTFSARLFFQCEAPENSSVDSNGNILQTGDDSNMLLYIIPLGVSLIALIIVFIIRRKRRK